MRNKPRTHPLTTLPKSNANSSASSVIPVKQSSCLSNILGFGGFFSRRSTRVYCENTEQQTEQKIPSGQLLFNNKPFSPRILKEEDILVLETDNNTRAISRTKKMSKDTLPLSCADSMEMIDDGLVYAPPRTPDNMEKLEIENDGWYQGVRISPLDEYLNIGGLTPRQY